MHFFKILTMLALINLSACSLYRGITMSEQESRFDLYEQYDRNKSSMRISNEGAQSEFQSELRNLMEHKTIGDSRWRGSCDCL